ncbi:hypothetical protein FQR65_LT13444 [Abscondita terminalis]|nr:hypothetical protein FQR65_LT13444 [Abscondita terminalis]
MKKMRTTVGGKTREEGWENIEHRRYGEKSDTSGKRRRMDERSVLAAVFLLVYVTAVFGKSKLNKCIAKTIEKVFAKNESIIYVHDVDIEFPISDANPRILFDRRTRIYVPSRIRNCGQNYVIVGCHFEHLRDSVAEIMLSRLWDDKITRESTFLVITSSTDVENKLKLFWRQGIINVVVLLYDLSSDMMRVLSSDPQAPGNNCGLTLKEVLSFEDCFSPAQIKLPKTFRKYTNCNVTYISWITEYKRTIKQYAALLFVLDLVVERLNVSLKMVNTKNTTYTMNNFFIMVQVRTQLNKHSYTSTYFTESLIWIVPFPQRIPDMMIINLIFKKIVWFFVLIAFLCASFTWWLITKAFNDNSSISEAFLKIYSITLLGSVDKFDLYRPMRCLFLAYVLYSIHIQTAFTSKLIEILTIPQYEPTIKTLTELAESNVKILTNELYYEIYLKTTNVTVSCTTPLKIS